MAKVKHGYYGTRVYRVWGDMKKRCYNQNFNKYKDYGGRNISVCEEWRDAKCFIDWALKNGYKDNLCIDRIDNDGNYEPSNVRFVTHKRNNRNRRDNRLLTYGGETKCMAAWAEEIGISITAVYSRLKRGWSIEKTLTTPLRRKN